MTRRTAKEEFDISSDFVLPPHHKAWKIRKDYPRSFETPPTEDKPWLRIDPTSDSKKYCEVLKEYFFRGNTENNFIVQENKVRNWYHPPWLHYGPWGREPINGLKFGGWLEKGYLTEKQSNRGQGWLCSYFNWEAATVLGEMWADPERIPKWDKHIDFPVGSVICENIFCDVNPDEVPIARWAPQVEACIGTLPPCWKPGDETPPERPGGVGVVKTLYLVQVDFAARDNRSPVGWVFGTYACDGRTKVNNLWDNVFPIGLQWGNDPDLLQKQYDEGKRPKQLWINPDAEGLLNVPNKNRPWFGWHDRLNGLADDFMGTCTSCHATAEFNPHGKKRSPLVQCPKPVKDENGNWVQKDGVAEKKWFRNLQHGTAFDEGCLSADFNMHVEFAYRNYLDWEGNREKK